MTYCTDHTDAVSCQGEFLNDVLEFETRENLCCKRDTRGPNLLDETSCEPTRKKKLHMFMNMNL
jgi:hypothetical protein